MFVSLLLLSLPLQAQTPPPLPKPNQTPTQTNNPQLESLGSLFNNSNSRVSHPEARSAGTSVQTAQHHESSLDDIPPPSQLRQAAAQFSVHHATPSALNEQHFYDNPYEKRSEEPYYDFEYEDHQDYIDAPSATLDKALHSRRPTIDASEYEDDDEANAGGWTNKLLKPNLTPLFSVGGSLLIVIASFFLLVILFRKVSPQGNRPLPKEAFECLGRYYLTQKHQVQVLRLGNRIVLVSVMPDGVSTLAEITDPDETVAFLGLCRSLDNNSATEMFRKTIAGMSDDELNRSQHRPVVTPRRNAPPQRAASLDLYSDPDESLASILARGRNYGR